MTYYSTPPRSDELYHYGIKGMRWGVRRYQNPDGTLTPAGKKRYYKYKDDIEIARKSLAESRKARSDKKSYEAFRPYLDARRRIANRIYTKDGTSLFRGGTAIDFFGSPANNRRAREAIALTDRLIKNANFEDMPKRRKKIGSKKEEKARVESELRKAMNQQVYWKRRGDAKKAQEAWDRRMELQKKLNNLR